MVFETRFLDLLVVRNFNGKQRDFENEIEEKLMKLLESEE